MKGDRMGVYECAGCGDWYRASDAHEFAGRFRPAALLGVDGHPMYWRGDV